MDKKAIFLDRDGVLNFDPPYIIDPSQIVILPGVSLALKKLKELGFLLIIISNQSLVARGLLTKSKLQTIDQLLKKMLRRNGVFLSKSYYCLHHPDFTGNCLCRKPQPGLLLKAIKELKIDIKKSWVIGDKITDLEAGRKAGCPSLILVPGNLKTWDKEKQVYPYQFYTAVNLVEAVKIVKNHS